MKDNLLNKLIRSKEIIDLLIEGENPFEESKDVGFDLINDIRYIRWLHFMSDYVTGEIQNITQRKGNNGLKNRLAFKISKEEFMSIKFPDYDIGISQFCKTVNEMIDTDVMEPLKAVDINSFLVQKGYLKKVMYSENKMRTEPTELGYNNGMLLLDGFSYGKKFVKISYGDEGKHFLLVSLQKMLSL
ncbi:hypothetical protein [Petrocella sp. FN5]|uniref:hypothetical protein n=1 Tax=Petrocella sp. FN5 TaxID=3032002 RepID=UPI0023DA4618|nr:hypothetical protein [Petrocella sp. FN5]MDF1616944.1 hypothetical protein [Petrocella sp. FN5]